MLEGRALTGLAAIHLGEGRPAPAWQHAERARKIQEATGDRLGLADSHVLLAGAGAPDEAHAHQRRALDLYAEMGVPSGPRLRILDNADWAGR